MLVGVVLMSTLLIGGLNFYAARSLLETGARDQLSSIGQSRARTIEAGAARLEANVSALAADLGVASALEELSDGYRQVDEELSASEEAELADWYRAAVVDPVESAGLGPISLDELLPGSTVGRFLQYHYIVVPAADGVSGRDLDDAGDGSAYSAAHAEHHPFLADLAGQGSGGDLLLISDDGDVVYSVEKRTDFGTNLVTGPYRDSRLATVARERLSRVAAGEAVIADWQIYLPARGRPTLFAAAVVRRDTEILGAIALEVPSEQLSAITTANQSWEEVGLPSGESYVVGPDTLLRSESRLWIEDPEAYLEQADDDVAELIEIFGSPVGIQPVETSAVMTALDGNEFDGQSTNYLGQDTYSSARPIDVEGVDWVVVVDTPLGEARDPLFDYVRRMGLVLLVMVPVAGAVGYGLANRLARPLPPLVEAARAVAEGDRDPSVERLGHDEVGDLGRRLHRTALELGRQEAELQAEFDHKRSLLLSVLPARVVNPEGDVGDSAESIEIATAVAVGVEAAAADRGDSDESSLVGVLAGISETAGSLAAQRNIEPVRLAADRHLFLAGVRSKSDGADDGVAFAADLVSAAKSLAEAEGIALSIHIGLSTGAVAMGVLERGSLTFGAWGDPVRRALAIAALSRADEILVDGSTAEAVEPSGFDFEAAEDVISLDGSPMALLALRTESRARR